MGAKGGRPTKYRPEMVERVLEFVGSGKSVKQFARELQVSRDTIYEWANQHPAFSDALTQAQQWSEAAWEEKIQEMMTSRDVNAPLVKLYLANRFGWSDKQEHAISGPGGAPIASEIKITHEIIDPSDPS